LLHCNLNGVVQRELFLRVHRKGHHKGDGSKKLKGIVTGDDTRSPKGTPSM